MEGVILRLDAGVLDHGSGVGLQTGHGTSDVTVYLDNLFDRGGFEESGGHPLFNSEDDAAPGRDSDGGRAKLDCFERVFNLEETAFGGEGTGGVLVTPKSQLEFSTSLIKTYLIPRSVDC